MVSLTIALVAISAFVIRTAPEFVASPIWLAGTLAAFFLAAVFLGFRCALHRFRKTTIYVALFAVIATCTCLLRPARRSIASKESMAIGLQLSFEQDGAPNGDWFAYGPVLLPTVLQETLGAGFFRNVKYLHIDGNEVTVEELREVMLPRRIAAKITFQNCDLSDPVFLRFGQECNAKRISIKSSNVTASVLDSLASMDNIKWINLAGTNLTKDEIERFASRNPGVGVRHGSTWSSWQEIQPKQVNAG